MIGWGFIRLSSRAVKLYPLTPIILLRFRCLDHISSYGDTLRDGFMQNQLLRSHGDSINRGGS